MLHPLAARREHIVLDVDALYSLATVAVHILAKMYLECREKNSRETCLEMINNVGMTFAGIIFFRLDMAIKKLEEKRK